MITVSLPLSLSLSIVNMILLVDNYFFSIVFVDVVVCLFFARGLDVKKNIGGGGSLRKRQCVRS